METVYKFKIDYYRGSEWEGQRTIKAHSRAEAIEKLWREVRPEMDLARATRDFDVVGVEEEEI